MVAGLEWFGMGSGRAWAGLDGWGLGVLGGAVVCVVWAGPLVGWMGGKEEGKRRQQYNILVFCSIQFIQFLFNDYQLLIVYLLHNYKINLKGEYYNSIFVGN
jgi:hypothetical protein